MIFVVTGVTHLCDKVNGEKGFKVGKSMIQAS